MICEWVATAVTEHVCSKMEGLDAFRFFPFFLNFSTFQRP